MEKEIKVGQSSRVFEVTDDFYRQGVLGLFTIEKNDDYHGNEFGVNLYVGGDRCDHFGIDNRNQARLVGKLTVTKVK